MQNTRELTDKKGNKHTLVARAKQVGLGWQGYVHDETKDITALTVTQHQRTESAALRMARIAMNDFANDIERKLRNSR